VEVCKRRNVGQFVIAASSYIQWLVVEPDIRRIPLAPLGRLAIWRRSLFDNSEEGPPSFLCAPYLQKKVESLRCAWMSGARAILFNL